MAGYPYYDSITGRMKGEQDDIEKVRKRLPSLLKAMLNDDESWVVKNDDGIEEAIEDEYEIEFIGLCIELEIGNDSIIDRFTFEIDREGILSLATTGDGFNREPPWNRLYPAISNMFPMVDFFFSTIINGGSDVGSAWHTITGGTYADSGDRVYYAGGLEVMYYLSQEFYCPELQARERLWLVEDGEDQNAIDKARKEYEKARDAADRMEKIAKLGNGAWEGNTGHFNFENGYIDNDLFAELLEVVKNGTLSDGGNYDEFPQSLEDIAAINLKGCEEITKLPEAVMGCASLREINLAGTGITEVPAWLVKMHEKQGTEIIVDENGLQNNIIK
ncbi:MAG: hypothetical protein LBG43_09150 [Treponema sp.]|jgi:hypothetical protein|nr:hypothetical protein [Treponema sp.]